MPCLFTFAIALENAFVARELLYFALQTTTLLHFSPHNRVLLHVVKRKTRAC